MADQRLVRPEHAVAWRAAGRRFLTRKAAYRARAFEKFKSRSHGLFECGCCSPFCDVCSGSLQEHINAVVDRLARWYERHDLRIEGATGTPCPGPAPATGAQTTILRAMADGYRMYRWWKAGAADRFTLVIAGYPVVVTQSARTLWRSGAFEDLGAVDEELGAWLGLSEIGQKMAGALR